MDDLQDIDETKTKIINHASITSTPKCVAGFFNLVFQPIYEQQSDHFKQLVKPDNRLMPFYVEFLKLKPNHEFMKSKSSLLQLKRLLSNDDKIKCKKCGSYQS